VKEQYTEHLQNRLLGSLAPSDFELLLRHLGVVSLRAPALLHDVGERVTHAYFPHSGAIFGGIVLSGGDMVESYLVGADGMVGGIAALDSGAEQHRCQVQIDGTASAIGMEFLRKIANDTPAIKAMLFRYQRFLLSQIQWAAACNACHTLEQRLAVCLLRLHEISRKDVLGITQERLGELLRVKRTSICLVAHRMQQFGLIQIRRGNIKLCDLEAIKKLSCECYGAVNSCYSSLFAAAPAHDPLAAASLGNQRLGIRTKQ